MRHKVSELEGALLDAAVAKAECRPADLVAGGWRLANFEPSTAWADGGPIIERERIAVWKTGKGWSALPPLPDSKRNGMTGFYWCEDDDTGTGTTLDVQLGDGMPGPTPLIAAMRAYVASRLGAEVEVTQTVTQNRSAPEGAS